MGWLACLRPPRLFYSRRRYRPEKPPYVESVNTQHTLDVVVGALLALSDGKLADMQALAEADGGVQQLNDAIGAAKALAAEL